MVNQDACPLLLHCLMLELLPFVLPSQPVTSTPVVCHYNIPDLLGGRSQAVDPSPKKPQNCWVRYMHCGNYEARGASGNYQARGASGNYKAWGASGGKYEARMVIFCILAAVNRFSRIS